MSTNTTSALKKQRLSEIKNEVKEFHPLLEEIFPKLPRVVRVDYTHGPNEKGADFIITRKDDTTEDNEYIGVIVKIGKLSKDLTKIYDQIDDCEIKRHILEGKKKIRLDEIWIITNDSISSNAEEKIYNKFLSRKIKFFKNTSLIRWIDDFLPNYWTNISIGFGQYLFELQSFMNEMDKTHSLLPAKVKPFYVEPELRVIENEYKVSRKKKRKSNLSDIYELIKNNNIVLIEGGPGAGKSQMVRNAVKHYCDPAIYISEKLVPICVSYQEYCKEFDNNITLLIDNKLGKCKIELEQDDSKYLIFFDGFDESVDKERSIDEEFDEFVNAIQSNNNVKAVITTRPLNIADYKNLLPDKTPGYEIVPLGINKVHQFFKHICIHTNISGKIFEDISRSDLFKQLPRNPISAILLAYLLDENSKDLPSNLTDIYAQYSELMLGRWEISKGLRSQKEFEAAKNIITYIAKYFIDNDLSAVTIDEAIRHFTDYLEKRNLDLNSNELFEKVTTRSGILQKDEKQNKVYFKHRSFLEFFYATYKAKHPDPNFINNRVYSIPWRSIYFFYVGLHKDCEEILTSILSIKPADENERFFRVVNMADYFLAAFSTPYVVVEKNLPLLINEYRDLYLDIVENKIDTPLRELSEIMILEFFKAVINETYSYEYFVKAFESAILELCSAKNSKIENAAYSLFFISVIYQALKKENPFDGLIENFKGKLPFPIQFGLFYESNNAKHHSTLLKRNERNLKQKIKKSPQLRRYVEKLHELPVSRKKSEMDDMSKAEQSN